MLAIEAMAKLFNDVDVVVTPTAGPAFRDESDGESGGDCAEWSPWRRCSAQRLYRRMAIDGIRAGRGLRCR